MQKVHSSLSTGLPGLDRVLQGVLPGDNIVWQVDSIEDYIPFVEHFSRESISAGKPLTYFRFADHRPLVSPNPSVHICELHPEEGFENFISAIFSVIENTGFGACYIFDCLSELSVDWYSDRMLGNFFMLTCPYLYDYDTATYFGLLRDRHMKSAIGAIHETAQVVIDIRRNGTKLYLHPQKVFKRHSPTMYMLHSWDEDQFNPVTSSAVISEIMEIDPRPWLDFSAQRIDIWTRNFRRAQRLFEAHADNLKEAETLKEQLLRMAVTRDSRLLTLASRYLDLGDLVNIGGKMIGTGLIGGKSAGMLIARAILARNAPGISGLLEVHDSFYIGSDVFYTYLVQNKCWWMRRKLKTSGSLLDGAEEMAERMLNGSFSSDINEQFMQMLDYFGQSPIIVRSSSLLEDAYGNAFSGKYESVFCANQGTPQDRLESFTRAVRTVYASTMSREALQYRARRGLLDQDEQMALLVQRVSGEMHGSYYYPHAAGVGFSFNPFVWNSEIDPSEGVLRLVFGLGTRAVDRSDDDYTRIVALNTPLKRPESSPDEVRRYTQRRFDAIDLQHNRLQTRFFEDVNQEARNIPLDIFAFRDLEMEQRAAESGREIFPYILTFDKLLSETGFVNVMRELLRTLHAAYEHAVDIEFTLNFADEKNFRINLVQCRPFQVKGESRSIELPGGIPEERILVRTSGPIIGTSRDEGVHRFIYVIPRAYSSLSMADRYAAARLIGKLAHFDKKKKGKTVMLLGPGRWGTSTPSLGVPVSFAEINTVSVLCEIAAMHEGLVPDVSLGTHFFNDLVELDMLYMAIYPEKSGQLYHEDVIQSFPNCLKNLVLEADAWKNVIHVLETVKGDQDRTLWLTVNSMKQEGVLYLK
ncbi:MAG: pyruvate, phosphate dikinase [Fibrobacter sp.]|nr:pyruvate, phosphate dikinase [Fibrobacter sp.]